MISGECCLLYSLMDGVSFILLFQRISELDLKELYESNGQCLLGRSQGLKNIEKSMMSEGIQINKGKEGENPKRNEKEALFNENGGNLDKLNISDCNLLEDDADFLQDDLFKEQKCQFVPKTIQKSAQEGNPRTSPKPPTDQSKAKQPQGSSQEFKKITKTPIKTNKEEPKAQKGPINIRRSASQLRINQQNLPKTKGDRASLDEVAQSQRASKEIPQPNGLPSRLSTPLKQKEEKQHEIPQSQRNNSIHNGPSRIKTTHGHLQSNQEAERQRGEVPKSPRILLRSRSQKTPLKINSSRSQNKQENTPNVSIRKSKGELEEKPSSSYSQINKAKMRERNLSKSPVPPKRENNSRERPLTPNTRPSREKLPQKKTMSSNSSKENIQVHGASRKNLNEGQPKREEKAKETQMKRYKSTKRIKEETRVSSKPRINNIEELIGSETLNEIRKDEDIVAYDDPNARLFAELFSENPKRNSFVEVQRRNEPEGKEKRTNFEKKEKRNEPQSHFNKNGASAPQKHQENSKRTSKRDSSSKENHNNNTLKSKEMPQETKKEKKISNFVPRCAQQPSKPVEQTPKEVLFRPLLCKKSIEIAEKLGNPIKRLVSGEPSSSASQKEESQMEFKPQINKNSKKICEKNEQRDPANGDRFERLYTMDQIYRRNLMLKKLEQEMKAEEEERQGHTFQPRRSSHYESHHIVEMGVVERNKLWEQKREERMAQEMELKNQRIKNECSFTPQIVKDIHDALVIEMGKNVLGK